MLFFPHWLLIYVPYLSVTCADNGGFVTLSIEEVPSSAYPDVISHAFVQTGSELHYFRDVSEQEILLNGEIEYVGRKTASGGRIVFDPGVLDFEESFIGMPVSRTVEVTNPTSQKIRFSAITGTSASFQCSFLHKKIISPGESTTFDVIFLPSSEGITESVLVFHTSNGKFPYTIKGTGRPSPYRIRPMVGIRIPLNATFAAEIQLHNPYPSVLRITEMFASDGDVHLELPAQQFSKVEDTTIWELMPYETRNVGTARIVGAMERNTTSFVNIRTSLREVKHKSARPSSRMATEDVFIPVEFEVTRKRDIFSVDNVLDFGLIREGERSKQLLFRVYSTADKSIEIDSVYVVKNHRRDGVYLQFVAKPPITVKSGARGQPGTPVAVATVHFDSKIAARDETSAHPRFYTREGLIIAESRGGNYNISVPYKATVFSGDLLHNPEDVAFHHRLTPPEGRDIILTNRFPFGVAVWNATLAQSGAGVFEVYMTSAVVRLAKGQTAPVLFVRYIQQKGQNFTTLCTIHTNVSSFEIPLFVFSGKLKVSSYTIERRNFNFGTIAPGEKRSILFSIANPGPVPVRLKEIHNPIPDSTVLSYVGIGRGNGTKLNQQLSQGSATWMQNASFAIPGRSHAVFNYTLRSSLKPCRKTELEVRSDYGTYRLPVLYQNSNETLMPVSDVIDLGDSFVGKVNSQEINVYSTFAEDVRVLRLSTLNADPRFFFQRFKPGSVPAIRPRQVSSLGTVYFMPEAACPNDCYLGIPLETGDGQWFSYGMTKLPQNLAEIDSYLYGRLRRKFDAIKNKVLNTTILLDTSTVRNFELRAQATLTWPKLLSHSIVHFPLTAVGNFTIVNLTLSNPSSQPVIVQLLPLVIYPDADAMVEFFREEFSVPLPEPVEMNETLMFSLRDTELFTLKPGSPVPKLREQVEEVVGSAVPRFTLSMLLQPGMKVRIRVGFLPSDYTLRSSLLLIRNNLTALEPVVLYGRGAHVNVEIDNRTARTEPLFFEIQPTHLSDCFNPKRLMHKLPTTLTVKRSFAVRNSGEVTFSVVNMSINNIPCENRGFRILNCVPFRLEPNETYFLDIAYTPDFLMTVNEAALQLYMHMNGTPWVFELGATLPHHLLSLCHTALPRPPFEGVMYYSCLFALLFCLICVIACSYLEGDRMITCSIRQKVLQDARLYDLLPDDSERISNTAKPSRSSYVAQRYRNHVQVSQDAGILTRSFWVAANHTLWLFAHIWVVFRKDSVYEHRNEVADEETVDGAKGAGGQTVIADGNDSPANGIVHSGDEGSRVPDTRSTSDAENEGVNGGVFIHVDPQPVGAMDAETQLRLRRKIKLMDADDVGRPRLLNGIRVKNEQQRSSKEDAATKSSQPDRHEAPRKAQSKRGKAAQNNSVSPMASPVLVEDGFDSDAGGKENLASRFGSSGGYTADSDSSLQPIQPTLRSKPSEVLEAEIPNGTDATEDGHLSDSSGPPEWADEPLDAFDSGNVEEDFSALALQSAHVFSDEINGITLNGGVPSRSVSQSPITQSAEIRQRSVSRETNLSRSVSRPRVRPQYSQQDNERISRFIDQLTREYRKRLEEAFANGVPLNQLKSIPGVSLTLPSDLRSDGWNEGIQRSANSGTPTSSQWPCDLPEVFSPLVHSPTFLASSSDAPHARASDNLFAELSNLETPSYNGTLPSDSTGIWTPLFEDYEVWRTWEKPKEE